ncbi:MAG: hypothetical protein JOZ58_06635, partial [Acetobacteraceae bacterium]|nr:hypothetical protein [Acetobacteraceae bacterium]
MRHHPEFAAFLLVADGDPVDALHYPEGTVVLLDEIGLHNASWYAAKFRAPEFVNGLKPAFLRYLAGFADRTVYMDSDIAVFSRLHELVDALDSADLVLIPHMLEPLPSPERFWIHPNRADIFNSGLINAGCLAIRLRNCQAFLESWHEANFAIGAFFGPAGYQTDQQNLNWALITVPNVQVLRETRYNVAYWNLHDRNLRVVSDPDGAQHFEVDGKPLGFFHFSGYDLNDRFRLSRHDGRHSVYDAPAVAGILNWYSNQILTSPLAWLLEVPYGFDILPNGFHMTAFVREVLKKYERYIPKFDIRTVAGADGLCAFLMDPLPASGSQLPLIAAEIYDSRPDLQDLCPVAHTRIDPAPFWRWFCRHGGHEYDLEQLIDRFRRSLISISIINLAKVVVATIGERECPEFLGSQRMFAAQRLAAANRPEISEILMETSAEWCFFNEVRAVFDIYNRRPDLQETFPDILGDDHGRFVDWLGMFSAQEHGLPARAVSRFAGCRAEYSLARLFSYISRHQHLHSLCQHTLLSDHPDELLRELIRGSGEGLEHTVDDVEVLRFIHTRQRHLLVPMYLEMPFIRCQATASRVAVNSRPLLPAFLHSFEWAKRGCEMHAAFFDLFDAYLDEEIRRRGTERIEPPRDVLSYLRSREQPACRLIEEAYNAALRRLPREEPMIRRLASRYKERKQNPGVNLFGYFFADIGVG